MHFNLLDLAEQPTDYSRSKILVPLSGGINSAAALCLLGEYHPEHLKPGELHLFYAHFKEHSPDTFKFVASCIRYARHKFSDVRVKITRNSVNKFFIEQHMIPHPTVSPCSSRLKINPMQAYDVENGIDVVLIGFVRDEISRYKRAIKREQKQKRAKEQYPLLNMSDEDCFYLVKQIIGWYPAIYDLRENGRRVFTHNNCLPCKNMSRKQLLNVGKHFPEYARRAEETAAQIPGAYWGRDDVPEVFKCDVCERM
jgi:3'-phosphoadenosine 5'-phosphosulfate sulfotransferase (PAPS reductase)/FAD synthetase